MELIDKEAFIKRIEKQREHLRPHIYEHDVIGDAAYTVVVEIAEQFPTSDAVPVVRCKDCKHHSGGMALDNLWCGKLHMVVAEDFYCKCGERKDNVLCNNAGGDGD